MLLPGVKHACWSHNEYSAGSACRAASILSYENQVLIIFPKTLNLEKCPFSGKTAYLPLPLIKKKWDISYHFKCLLFLIHAVTKFSGSLYQKYTQKSYIKPFPEKENY